MQWIAGDARETTTRFSLLEGASRVDARSHDSVGAGPVGDTRRYAPLSLCPYDAPYGPCMRLGELKCRPFARKCPYRAERLWYKAPHISFGGPYEVSRADSSRIAVRAASHNTSIARTVQQQHGHNPSSRESRFPVVSVRRGGSLRSGMNGDPSELTEDRFWGLLACPALGRRPYPRPQTDSVHNNAHTPRRHTRTFWFTYEVHIHRPQPLQPPTIQSHR
ncbi:hypothetical protein C8Q78DRAFT_739626 [Trametes maxima]|nr:hypothetical protein C8Q78DRAFT_739626 [Trametes maxima]